MDIIICDENKTPLYAIADYTLDCAFGDDENTIEITCDPEYAPPNKGYAFIDGTEYGGTIDEVTASTTTSIGGGRSITATGRSWHGVLAGKILVPDSGSAYITVSGSISTVLQSMINRMGLSDLFSAPSSESDDVTVSSFRFTRFTDGYTGLRALCKAYGLKLTMRVDENVVLLGARAVVDYGATFDSDLIDFDITEISRRTNHLVCGGEGEGTARTIIHYYADTNGNVSTTQTQFGVDEIAAFYDYNNADDDTLAEEGQEKLEDLQGEGTVEVEVHDDLDIDIGDIVASRDNTTGLFVSAEVTKKIAKVSSGVASFSYEIGTASSGTSNSIISGSGESSSGGHAYYAGEGLTLTNYTFSADVTQSDLDAVTSTANSALTAATNAVSAAGAAEVVANAAVATISSDDPISVSRTDNAVTITHNDSGVSAGAYGATSNVEADWGDTVTIGARLSIDSEGHITSAAGRSVTLPDNTATSTEAGLMSASDKVTLDSVINTYLQLSGGTLAGSVTAPSFIGALIGNADTATKLATPRTIAITGAVNGSATFDGSRDIQITVTGDTEAAGFLAAHPVGSIFETTSSDNPGTIYGGTWESMPSVGAYKWERTA